MSDVLDIQQRGHGPLRIALIHGWAMTSALFAPIVERFQDVATLHLIDLPGHGRSHDCTLPLQPLNAVADQLAQRIGEDAVWLGWSMGGLFAQAAAQRTQARGLVFLSSTPCFAEQPDWPFGLRASVLKTMRQAVATDARQTVNDFLQLEVLGVRSSHPQLQAVRDAAFAQGLPTATALEQGLDLLGGSDIRSAIAELNVPNLWIGGSRDRLVSPQTLQAAAALNPHGSAQILQGAGHAAFISAPDSLNQQLLDFAQTHGWL